MTLSNENSRVSVTVAGNEQNLFSSRINRSMVGHMTWFNFKVYHDIYITDNPKTLGVIWDTCNRGLLWLFHWVPLIKVAIIYSQKLLKIYTEIKNWHE